MPLSPLFQPVAFDDLPGWARRRSSRRFRCLPALGLPGPGEALSHRRARRRFRRLRGCLCRGRATVRRRPMRTAARTFFERHFLPGQHRCPRQARPASSPASMSRRPRPRRSGPAEFRVPLLSRPADLVDVDDENRPGRHGSRILPSAARRQPGLSNISTARRSKTGALAGTGPGDRLAGGQGRCLLHPRPGRGAAEHDRRDRQARHLCREIRPALFRPGQDPGRARRDPARKGDDAVDPGVVPATIRTASTRSCSRTAPISSSARRRSTTRRSARSPRPRCR